MSGRGTDWYKRFPIEFMDGVEGMGPELIGVYAYVLDLIYARGGKTPRDDQALAGRIGCSKRKITTLVDQLIARGKLQVRDGYLTHKHAEHHASTRRALSEERATAGRQGGEKSGQVRKNKALGEASASSKIEPEKRREEKSSVTDVTGSDAANFDHLIWKNGVAYLVRHSVSERQARSLLGKWRKQHGDEGLIAALREASQQKVIDPVAWLEKRFQPAPTVNLKEITGGKV